jgi:hypothetical protein
MLSMSALARYQKIDRQTKMSLSIAFASYAVARLVFGEPLL